MRPYLLVLLLIATAPAGAQVYRWVDAKGTVTYSQSPPPAGVKATVTDIQAKEGPPAADTAECYTIRCQGERMDARIAKREELEARLAAERAAAAPKPNKGLEFRKYISIQRGMSEGEMLTIAGEPDLVSDQGVAIAVSTVQTGSTVRRASRTALAMKTYTYLPTSPDPFTTTITLVGGRVSEVERVRKF